MMGRRKDKQAIKQHINILNYQKDNLSSIKHEVQGLKTPNNSWENHSLSYTQDIPQDVTPYNGIHTKI